MSTPHQLPWSPEAEAAARGRVQNAWEAMWLFLICFVICVLLSMAKGGTVWIASAALFFGLAVFTLRELNRRRELLGEPMQRLPSGGRFYEGSGMLRNKPRSTRALTPWVNHIPNGHAFSCRCGQVHDWSAAQWIPNYELEAVAALASDEERHDGALPEIDPCGGRYVILCPCGLGHYKLKEC